ncbi:hypothetical protein HPO96_22755 [Kribbella sandramycini]|uniref:PPE family protein n=1 Tax=Kribbella sandramycini TaxID=60450 RepID=A0A7Y4L2F1_9ACTN|nr:hypothetical protein [Kribbella sandramycini]MBB6566265.1 hypothetical protein [Kribbella sandramycini]NOL43072.1 hypothetical protein [Kribbella sandramycini]
MADQSDYAAAAKTAQLLDPLLAAMREIDRFAQAELNLRGPLQMSADMWQTAAGGMQKTAIQFRTFNQGLLDNKWRSPSDSGEYRDASEASVRSLQAGHDSIAVSVGEGTGGPAGGGIPAGLRQLAQVINDVATASTPVLTNLEHGVSTFRAECGTIEAPKSPWTSELVRKYETENTNNLRSAVVAVGNQLNMLAVWYSAIGRSTQEAAQALKWDGPGGPKGSPAPNRTASAPPGGGPAGPGETPSTDQAAGPQPGQDTPGETPAEMPAEAPGGMPPGGMPPGGMPPGGPSLAGMPPGATLPKPPVLPPLTPPVLPDLTHPIPPAGPPAMSGIGVPPSGGPRGGGAGLPRGAGIGGLGGIKGLGKPGIGLPGTLGSDQVARAAHPLQAPPALSGGQAPSNGLSSTSTAGPAGAGGGMPPPMMPPGGAAGAGPGGRAGKPGASTIRPPARKRTRRDETPGVPSELRGRSGRDLPAAFPLPPATPRRRPDKDPQAQTLQLLDEDLWKVEHPEPAPPPTPHRHAT